jgi:hypothetical protein
MLGATLGSRDRSAVELGLGDAEQAQSTDTSSTEDRLPARELVITIEDRSLNDSYAKVIESTMCWISCPGPGPAPA